MDYISLITCPNPLLGVEVHLLSNCCFWPQRLVPFDLKKGPGKLGNEYFYMSMNDFEDLLCII